MNEKLPSSKAQPESSSQPVSKPTDDGAKKSEQPGVVKAPGADDPIADAAKQK